MTNKDSTPTHAPTTPKKPYAKPAVVFREPLEAIASTCINPPAKATPATCTQGPISS